MVQKLGEVKNCQNPFPAINDQNKTKNSTAIKAEGGGGKALMARPLRKGLYFAASQK